MEELVPGSLELPFEMAEGDSLHICSRAEGLALGPPEYFSLGLAGRSAPNPTFTLHEANWKLGAVHRKRQLLPVGSLGS